MSHIVQITHRPTKKAKVVFEFNLEAKTYTHNEAGPMRADLLNTMGKKLSVVDIDYHYSTVAELEVWLYKFVYVPLSATDKASIKSFKRKAITALNKVIKENIEYTQYSRASLAQEKAQATLGQAETNDFDFDFDFDDSNDFNFGADLTDEQPTPEPDTKSKDEINLKVDALFIDCARSVESLCLSIAALCRIAIEQENEKPSE